MFVAITTLQRGGWQNKMMHLICCVLLLFVFALNTQSQVFAQPNKLKLGASNIDESGTYANTYISKVLAAWRAKAEHGVVPATRIQELFQELSFHLNEKQISEVLQIAKGLVPKSCPKSNGLTFGAFCVLAADRKGFRTSYYGPISPGYGVNASATLKATIKNKLQHNKKSSLAEVFLGGSCNPTTWRADVAMPTLKKQGISFYNPQVSDWTPDLMELENRAKEEAKVLFFVMDSETRASASAIESAYIAGENSKHLVLVIKPYTPNQCILNERISQSEYIDLTSNQQILRELVTHRGLPVFNNIPLALQHTENFVKRIEHAPTSITSVLIATRNAFNLVNPINDRISLEKCQQALLYLGYSQNLVTTDNLKKIIAGQKVTIVESDNKNRNRKQELCYKQGQHHVDFNMFCVISAYISVLQQKIHENSCLSPIKKDQDKLAIRKTTTPATATNCDSVSGNQRLNFREVYLGGSFDARSKWREQLAIPYLKAKGITYHLPSPHEINAPNQLNFIVIKKKDVSCQSSSSRSLEAPKQSIAAPVNLLRPNLYNPSIMDASRVLLFVITNETRSFAPMTLAAHSIGLMYNVVLSVQMLPDNAVIGNERLTAAAIKDCNRGRSYLIDLAKRQGVPVFNDIHAALEFTAKMIKSYNPRR